MRRYPQFRTLRSTLARRNDSMEDFARNRREEACLAPFGFRPGIGVDCTEHCVERRVGTGRYGKFKPAIDEQVGRTGRFGKQDRILVAHRDDRRSQVDVLGVLTGGGEERKRRGQVVIEMSLIGPARLVTQPLGFLEQLDPVAQTLRRSGFVVERHPGVEAKPLLWAERHGQRI